MTRAVDAGIASGRFADPEWMRRWDVTFAGLYLDAHINFDLPQALLDVISDEEFRKPEVRGPAQGRPRAHRRDPREPGPREDLELRKVEQPGDRTLLDWFLTPPVR